MTILVLGGAGFIGSHFLRFLQEKGEHAVVVDNLSSGFADAVPGCFPLVNCSIGDRETIRRALAKYNPTSVVDFAGLIQVGESMQRPDRYYSVNVCETLSFLSELCLTKVRSFVFSSSAAVYGNPIRTPIDEEHPKDPINPYGCTKRIVEMAALDYSRAFGIRVACLRYFNAAGAHPDGSLRERHKPETHAIPLIVDACLGRSREFLVFGDDWPTDDGTCVRDFIHVVDLAEAHWRVLEYLEREPGPLLLNLGTGTGWSVRQVIETVANVLGRRVPYRIGPRRDGDPPSLVAAVDLARSVLGWTPERSDIRSIVEDAVRSRMGR